MQVLTEDEKNMRDAIASLENDIKISLSNNLQKLLDNIKNVLEHYQNVSLPEKKALLQSVILDVKYTKKKKTKPTDFSLEIEYVSFFD
jgi:gas vesicle protein